MQLSAYAPCIVVVQQLGAALEEGDAGLIRAHRKILEITAVADAGDVGIEAQPLRQIGDVGDVNVGAIAVHDRVIRQEILFDLTVRARRQKAKFAAELHAARGQIAGRQRSDRNSAPD